MGAVNQSSMSPYVPVLSGGSRDWENQGPECCPQLIPLCSRAGFVGTTPLILISKRREIPQRDELFLLHPEEHLQNELNRNPLHLCLTWGSEQELGQGGVWGRTRGLG